MPTYIFNKEIIEKIHSGEVSAAISSYSKLGEVGMRVYFYERIQPIKLVAISRLKSVETIIVNFENLQLNHKTPSPEDLEKTIKACGFDNYSELVAGIKSGFTIPFVGKLHSWHPPEKNSSTVSLGAA